MQALRNMINLFDEQKVPWTYIFGNHDYDGWAYGDMTMEMHANGYSEADRMDKDLPAAWAEIFGEKFANEGAVRDVARVALGTLRPTQIRDSAFAGHMLVRSIRKAVRAANAEQSKAAEAAKAVKAKSS